MPRLGIMEHGTETRIENTVPKLGTVLEAKGTTLSVIPPQPFEVHFRADQDVMTIPLGAAKISVAHDADKLTSHELGFGHINFHPVGSRTRSVLHKATGDVIAIALPDGLRNRVAQDFGRDPMADGTRAFMDSPDAAEIARMVRKLVLRPGQVADIEAETTATLAILAAFRACLDEPTPVGRLDERRLGEVYDYIDANLSQQPGLAELAGLCGISVHHFARAFKAATGLSPHAYVLERRVQRAREALANGTDSIAEIAYDTGFSSQSHMTDTFRRLVGTTPGRYRSATYN